MSQRLSRIHRVGLRLPPLFRWFLYAIVCCSWFTGLVFFILREFLVIEGDFGPQMHPLQFPTLLVHGLCAFLMIFGAGGMLFAHVPHGWKSGKQRVLGSAITSVVLLQVLTGYLLYYLDGDVTRDLAGYIHLGIGVFVPFILLAHVKTGKTASVK